MDAVGLRIVLKRPVAGEPEAGALRQVDDVAGRLDRGDAGRPGALSAATAVGRQGQHLALQAAGVRQALRRSEVVPDGPERAGADRRGDAPLGRLHALRSGCTASRPTCATWVIGYGATPFWRDFWPFVDVDTAAHGADGQKRLTHERASPRLLGGALRPPLRAAGRWPRPRRRPRSKVLRYAFPVAETGFDPPLADGPVFANHPPPTSSRRWYTYDYLARSRRRLSRWARRPCPRSPRLPHLDRQLHPGIFFADDPAFGGKRREVTAQMSPTLYKRFSRTREQEPVFTRIEEEKILGLPRAAQGRRQETRAVRL